MEATCLFDSHQKIRVSLLKLILELSKYYLSTNIGNKTWVYDISMHNITRNPNVENTYHFQHGEIVTTSAIVLAAFKNIQLTLTMAGGVKEKSPILQPRYKTQNTKTSSQNNQKTFPIQKQARSFQRKKKRYVKVITLGKERNTSKQLSICKIYLIIFLLISKHIIQTNIPHFCRNNWCISR